MSGIGSRKQALARADGQCEVMITGPGVARRCPGWADEVIYLLPPERGGKHLDRSWEDYHLLVCCRPHARAWDDPDDLTLVGLVIEGKVEWVEGPRTPNRKSAHHAVYHGPDPYLAEHYPVPG